MLGVGSAAAIAKEKNLSPGRNAFRGSGDQLFQGRSADRARFRKDFGVLVKRIQMHLAILCQTVYREDCIQRIAADLTLGLTRRDLLLRLALAQSSCLIAIPQTPPGAPPVAAAPAPTAPLPADSDLLHQLRASHPRLILTDAD